jgi:hypothetical protein
MIPSNTASFTDWLMVWVDAALEPGAVTIIDGLCTLQSEFESLTTQRH